VKRQFIRSPYPVIMPPQRIPPRQPSPRKRMPIWARIVLVVIALLLVTGGSAFAYYEFNFAHTINDITGQTAIRKSSDQQSSQQSDPLTQRTTIVLLGSDTDGKGNDPNQGQPLAQTVIVITVDPQTNDVGMLSIPRDMQVTDNDYSYTPPGGKIDEVFQAAWQGKDVSTRARTAAGHIMDIIQNNYGIHIDHYAWVGLQGFIKVINEFGGVDIDITHPITDDNYPDDTNNSQGSKYDYQRLYLPPGPQHLDGQTALEYVRTRHADLGGDFGRTERQQQVLSQLKEEASQTNSITKVPQILKDLDSYLMTDMTLNQLASFAQLAKNVDVNKIDHVSLTPPDYAQQIRGDRGNFAPICSSITAKIQHMFDTQPNCIPQASISSAQTPVARATTTGISTHTTQIAQASQVASLTTTNWQQSMRDRLIDTAGLHNILKLMLLTVSGSFNAMQ
jgi:LCP family protein required for cell wall assembly